MNDQPCKYIGCENSGTNHGRACYKCVQKYRGVNPKPPTHPRVNKWRKVEGRYKNIERKPPPSPDQEEVNDFSDINRQYFIKSKKEAIASTKESVKANTLFFNENENLNYAPHDDGFKTYKKTKPLDTVGKIKLPWDK